MHKELTCVSWFAWTYVHGKASYVHGKASYVHGKASYVHL